jgi:hypothetical protein
MYQMHVVSQGKYDDRGYSNEESISYLQLTKPVEINSFLTYNFGMDDDRFPLTFMTEGQGATGVTDASSYSPSQMETETTIPTKDTIEVDTAGERSFEGKGYNVITYGKHINQDNRRIDTQTYLSENAHVGEDESKHDGRVHGNIGVMTSQQMAQQTLELYKFNIYEYIAAQFAVKFLYEVW